MQTTKRNLRYFFRLKKIDKIRFENLTKNSPFKLKESKNDVRVFWVTENNKIVTGNVTNRLLLVLGVKKPKNARDRQFLKQYNNGKTRYNFLLGANNE